MEDIILLLVIDAEKHFIRYEIVPNIALKVVSKWHGEKKNRRKKAEKLLKWNEAERYPKKSKNKTKRCLKKSKKKLSQGQEMW